MMDNNRVFGLEASQKAEISDLRGWLRSEILYQRAFQNLASLVIKSFPKTFFQLRNFPKASISGPEAF
jgi:hypothetical protein